MGDKRLKLILPAIIIIVMLVVGLGAVMLFMRVPSQGVEADDVFQDDVYVEDSDAGGTVSASTVLKDSQGNVIRRSAPDDYVIPYLIVDPVTEEEVTTYAIEIGFDCWGIHIDWSTFVLSGVWTYTAYIGVTTDTSGPYQVTQDEQLGAETASNPPFEPSGGQELVSGALIFPDIDLLSLMPDTISYRIPDEDGVMTTYVFDQKTSWDHTFTYVFDADFTLSVDDDWGNTYDSSYNMHVALCLLWSGSDFGVNWNGEDDETTTTTTTPTTTDTRTTGTEATTQLPTTPVNLPMQMAPIDVRDHPGDPVADLESRERIYLTNTGTGGAIAAAFTGAVGSMMLVVGILLISVPLVIFWFSRRK